MNIKVTIIGLYLLLRLGASLEANRLFADRHDGVHDHFHKLLCDGWKICNCSNSFSMCTLELDALKDRRNLLSLKFALKAEEHEKFKFWFKLNEKKLNTRQSLSKYCYVKANHKRFEKSPLSYLTKLLNIYHSK